MLALEAKKERIKSCNRSCSNPALNINSIAPNPEGRTSPMHEAVHNSLDSADEIDEDDDEVVMLGV